MLLADLKSATADHHARVEAAMPSLDELATRDGYATALRALHGFHAAWEPAIWRAPGVEGALGDRRKLPLLERDLRALGVRAEARRPAPAELDGTAEAFGALYVLEGATLGGRVIQRRVAGPLGVTPEAGGAYYHGYGDGTGARWKEFGRVVTGYADETGTAARIVAGAVACFAALEAWLAVPGVLDPPRPRTAP
jgi:heme oxygenase (biliverdin-IX-beta and delta-forming)